MDNWDQKVNALVSPRALRHDILREVPMTDEYERVLTGVGPRLKRLRQDRTATLQDVSTATGISVSTLSRLESGQRRPTLELLLPLAREYRSRSTSWSAPRRPGIHGSGCSRSPGTARP